MPFTAQFDITIPGPIEAVYSRFIDYRLWAEWMPSIFRPMRGPSRPLRTGDRLLVRIAGLPQVLKVENVDAPREVRWGGGVPGVLRASHSFLFEAAGDKATRIHSVEPWTGVLTRLAPLAAKLQVAAEGAAQGQLRGFERWFTKQYAGFAS